VAYLGYRFNIYSKKIDVTTTDKKDNAESFQKFLSNQEVAMARQAAELATATARESRLATAVETVTANFYKTQESLQIERLGRIEDAAKHQAERAEMKEQIEDLTATINGLIAAIEAGPPLTPTLLTLVQSHKERHHYG
jgi:hypothetical protein